MENKPRKVIRISRTKLIIGIVVLLLILATLVVLGRTRNMLVGGGHYGAMEMSSSGSVSSADIPRVDFGDDYSVQSNSQYPSRYPTPYPNPSPDSTDTREFLKVSYSAQIQTRDVADKVKDIKNAVRDAEGRVDNLSSSDKYGYVSFVVAKDKFDQLKDEIESLTKKKLYTENISSQNLLGQKQGIEQQGESIATRLAQLEKQKKDADAQHVSRVNALQNQLAEIRVQISQAEGDSEKSVLRQREATLHYNLDQENKTYASKNSSLVAQIAQQKKNLEGNVKEDIQFGNNIETVTGSVNVNWVSCWEVMKIYSPIHPSIIIIVLVLVVLYFLNRKSYLPRIEVV